MQGNIDLSTCSERFLKGVKWLENELKLDEEKRGKLHERIEELKKIPQDSTEAIAAKYGIKDLSARLRLGYRCCDVEAIYLLSKTNSKLVGEFVAIAKKDSFWEEEDTWDWLREDSHLLWFFEKLGLGGEPNFLEKIDQLIKQQSLEGYMQSNECDHSGPMRVLVASKPESKALVNAVDYWVREGERHYVIPNAVGILALTELDLKRHSNIIKEQVDHLKILQNADGSWSFTSGYKGGIRETSYAIWAISRVNGNMDSSAQRGLDWLVENQQDNGSWKSSSTYTAWGLLALLAMGEGPKMPLEFVDWQSGKLKRIFEKQKPVFLHTSPLYKGSTHVKQIFNKVSGMLRNAQKEIRIASPFIDMLYEEIINLKQENPSLTIKIITRPKKEVEGMRERIAKNVIDLLNIATKGNVVQSTLIHSRIVIIDDAEVLVSSADLTRDQLFDGFNAGIWTADKETVRNAIEFFENLFLLGKEGT